MKNRALYKAPEGNKPPPIWIRGLLILTCTGVSFAHGSNDGQKGMGLIMLILVGTLPMAYALNRAMPADQIPRVAALAISHRRSSCPSISAPASVESPRAVLTEYVRTGELKPAVMPALAQLSATIADDIRQYGDVNRFRRSGSATRATTCISRRKPSSMLKAKRWR